MTDAQPPEETASANINTYVPHAPRIWNHWLGGKDNFAVDREIGDRMAAMYPDIVRLARADRAFLSRAVRHLVEEEEDIRQFLDVGTGLPTAKNTHQVAQAFAPGSRVVYVDNDPLVLSHARAVLVSTPEGATDYIDADLHDPETILRRAADTLDLDRPVAVMLLGVLIYPRHRNGVRQRNEAVDPPMTLRSDPEIVRFFDGLRLLEPGVVSCTRWRPGVATADEREVDEFCGVARKP